MTTTNAAGLLDPPHPPPGSGDVAADQHHGADFSFHVRQSGQTLVEYGLLLLLIALLANIESPRKGIND